MDNAVALVQAYLRVNGYFTVAEYPIVEAAGHRSLTDLDILAFRFPRAGHRASQRRGRQTMDAEVFRLDPALGRPGELADMLVGEVKEGRVRLNEAARDPAVLRAGLTRFGCCSPEEAPRVVAELGRVGHAKTNAGHAIRLVAFGSIPGEEPAGYTAISLGHVVAFLKGHLRRHWDVVRHVQTKEPVLGFLLTLEKALRGLEGFDANRSG